MGALCLSVVPLWLLLWVKPQKVAKWFWPVIVIVLISWWSANTYRFHAFEQELYSFRKIISKIEPGQRLGRLMMENTHRLFSHPVLLHFPAWYQATGGGLTDMSFATTHPSMIRYPDSSLKRIDGDALWEPATFGRDRHGANRYDYFMVYASQFDGPVFWQRRRYRPVWSPEKVIGGCSKI